METKKGMAMFNSPKKNKRDDVKREYIGEVLCFHSFSVYRTPIHNAHKDIASMCNLDWFKFTEDDIGKKHDGFIEIFGSYHKKENVFFYDDVNYGKIRSEIKESYKRKKSRS